LGAELEEGQEG